MTIGSLLCLLVCLCSLPQSSKLLQLLQSITETTSVVISPYSAISEGFLVSGPLAGESQTCQCSTIGLTLLPRLYVTQKYSSGAVLMSFSLNGVHQVGVRSTELC